MNVFNVMGVTGWLQCPKKSINLLVEVCFGKQRTKRTSVRRNDAQ